MPLTEKDKAFIRGNSRLSSRQLAKKLGASRSDVEKFLEGGVRAESASEKRLESLGRSLPPWVMTLGCALALAAQNLLMFHRHYFGETGVPGDFGAVNYAIPFFWMTSLQEGIFPQWVPFQAMGYPLQINLVSNLFYAPFWLFSLLGQTYTIRAAFAIQWVHVFFGAAGAFFLARKLGLAPLAALAAGAAYQAFGGFYHNAQHDTIVRSYAMIPWLLSGLTLSASFRWAALTVPAAVLFIVTGGYPGALFASLFMAGVYLAAQVFLPGSGERKEKIFTALRRGGLLALGLALAAVQLVPAALQRQELARLAEFQGQELQTFRWLDFFTLYLSADSVNLHLVAGMRSLFVTLPVFAMLFFLRKDEVRRHLPLFVLALTASLMATGSLFYSIAAAVLPPLKFSRFPCADYRAFVCLPLILLGAAALSRAMKDRPGFGQAGLRAVVFLVVFAAGWTLLPSPGDTPLRAAQSAFLFLAFAGLLAWKGLPAQFLAVLFAGLVVWNGHGTHRNLTVWQVEDYYRLEAREFESSVDSSKQKYDYGLEMTGGTALRARLSEELTSRPARRVSDKRLEYMEGVFNHVWRGYLTGVFMLGDYSSGMQLARQRMAYDDPAVNAFMAEPSRALVLPAEEKLEDLDSLKRAISAGRENPGVTLKKYGVNGLTYAVKLDKPATLVENEMYFPGWTAKIEGEGGGRLAAEAAGGLVRAWRLPAGEYALDTRFEMPHFIPAALASLAALGFWAALLAWTSFRRGSRGSRFLKV